MSIAAIYVLLEDGRCIFNHNLVPSPPPYLLVTGLLAALQDFVHEVSNSYIKNFSAGDYTFYCEKRGYIQVVIASTTHLEDKSHIEFNLLQITLRFINKYGELLEDWEGDTVIFDSFIGDLEEILGKDNLLMRESVPTDPLTSLTLVRLNRDLQKTAQALLQIQKGTVVDISKISERTVYQTQGDLDKLVDLGHIGRYNANGKWVYFIQ